MILPGRFLLLAPIMGPRTCVDLAWSRLYQCGVGTNPETNPFLVGVTLFAGMPPADYPPKSLLVDIQGNDLGVSGNGGVGDLLNDSLLQSERQVFGFALQE